MSDGFSDPLQDRRKRTIWLLAGGAASLLLPLGGVAYLRWNEVRPVPGPGSGADVFEHRDEPGGPVIPSQVTPNVVALPPQGAARKPASSLDFIQPDPDFGMRTAAAAAAAPAPRAAPPSGATGPGLALTASTATAATAAAAKKPAKKPFVMPKLQPTRGFSSFGSTGGTGSGPVSGGNAQQMLQNLPAGAQNNPALQQYLQNQQGH